jgi:SdrD B-like protein/type IX secretion system substrate protein
MKFLRLLLTLVLIGVFSAAVSVAKGVKGTAATGGATKEAPSLGSTQSIAPSEQTRLAPRFQERLRREENGQSSLLPGKGPGYKDRTASASSNPVLRSEMSATAVPLAAGTYTIPSATLPSLSYAANYITFVGISGDVIIELTNSTYNELPITFGAGNYTPASNSFSVTIRPAATKHVTVNVLAGASYGKGIAFVGSNRITINGNNGAGTSLKLQYDASSAFPSGDVNGAMVYISDGSDSISILNTTIKGILDGASISTATDARDGISIHAATLANSNITISNDTISNAYIGIKALCGANGTADLSTKTMAVTGNDISATAIGIAIDGASKANCSNNRVHDLEYTEDMDNNYSGNDVSLTLPGSFAANGFVSGIWFRGVDAASPLRGNVIDNFLAHATEAFGFTMYGIRTSGAAASPVTNNVITRLRSDLDSACGIFAFRLQTSAAYFNSVHLTGATADGNQADCLRPSSGTMKNNAASNELNTGPDGISFGLDWGGGTTNHNAYYCDPAFGYPTESGSLADHITGSGQDSNSVEGNPFFLGDSDGHINTAALSSAENIGDTASAILAAGGTDIDGAARSVTGPDAGADEFTLGSAFAKEVFPGEINPPLPGGVPASLPLAPIVTVKNNRPNATGAFNLHLKISDGYDHSVSVSLNPLEYKAVTFPNWTPAGGSYTITAISELAGDLNVLNDTISRSQDVTPATVVAVESTFDWNSGDQGWTRTVDWVRKNSFTKLGGPLAGYSMVTERPNHTNTYTEGALGSTEGYSSTYPGPNFLISPWFDLSTMTGPDLYISFSHSISVEPGWDASWLDYTVDGSNWKHVGALNDANGINWYSSSVYKNTPSYAFGNPPDTLTMKKPNYLLFGPGSDNPTLPIAWWTSNGHVGDPVEPGGDEGPPTGPTGYVFAQLHISLGQYTPEIVHAPLVKFRYVAFSDAVNPPSVSAAADTLSAFAGWAVDNWRIGKTGATFTGGHITGSVFNDVNGNGVNDAEPAEVGLKVYISYFGVLKDSQVTIAGGAFDFNLSTVNAGLPGIYNIQVSKPGYAFTVPNPPFGIGNINHPGDGSTVSAGTFGTFLGSISGTKYKDRNRNGVKDGGEPGLSGWTINLHTDSCTGPIQQTAVTDANGNYTFLTVPGTYYVSETQQTNWITTDPVSNCIPITHTGNSGVPGEISAGVNFGNYKKALIKLEKLVDLNGNGIKEAGDVTPLPSAVTAKFYLKKGATIVDSVTLGNLVTNVTLARDTGSYTFTEASVTPGWVRTFPATANTSFVVDTSGISLTVTYMNFKMITLSGVKYEDKNGNGVRDTLEHGLAGWTINVTGAGTNFYGATSAVTDSNGNWSIDSVGGPNDTLREVVKPGWSQTQPASGFYAIGTLSGANQTGKDFGNFKNDTISGVKYRDRNANGTREAGEEGLPGWQINMTGVGGGSTTTDSGGHYSFLSVGPGSHILTETAQLGWTLTQPAGGNYTFTPTSGVSQSTGHDFGNFKSSDSTTRYRTFTSDEFEDGAQHKATKPLKQPSTKPYVAPNLQALMKDYFKQFGLTSEVNVGVANVLNAGGKVKAYVFPKSYTDVFKSLWDKGITHSTDVDSTEIHRGLDVDNKGKQLLKRYKSLSPKKQKNDTFEELLVLSCNIALSDAGKTPAGLGSLIYDDGVNGAAYNGLTVNQIMAAANTVMTNTDFVPLSVYVRLEEVASKINDAFSCGGVDCETIQPFNFDTASWNTSAKVLISGLYPVSAVPYMKANPNATPTTTPKVAPVPLPEVYALYQNYPNPFNPTTTIEFDLPSDANVTLKIYNILGQEIARLFENQVLDAGNQDVDFDATALPSGVYFYRLTAQSLDDEGVASGQTFTQVKKMMLIK